jgi:hypothetical protein
MSLEQIEAKLLELPADERQRFAQWFRDHEDRVFAPESLDQRFKYLASEWKNLQGPRSNIGRLATHPIHLEILKLGTSAIPLILKDIKDGSSHWFTTLRSLVGSSPVSAEAAGNIAEMRDAWIRWGKEQGYLK